MVPPDPGGRRPDDSKLAPHPLCLGAVSERVRPGSPANDPQMAETND